MKPTLLHLPIEAYQSRYSELLQGWEQKAFEQKFKVIPLLPDEKNAVTVIQSGSVLDAVTRPLWAMDQLALLLKNHPSGQIYCSDFFHPGLEALPYTGRDYRAYSFCWAQSFDQYDFTRKMQNWMRPWEVMALAVYRKVFVASPLLQDLILTACPGLTEENVIFSGLPFDSADVAQRFDPAFQPGPYDVVYSSRFDTEKRPDFFLDMVELLPNLSFAICTGHEELRGNDYSAVARAQTLANKGRLTIHADLTKPEYYSVLKASKVQLNVALQDWVSFTLLEALTHGCTPVYPCWRDFPSVFTEMPGRLYSPQSRNDAADLITQSVAQGMTIGEKQAAKRLLAFHDGTLDRIADVMLNDQ